MHRIERYQEKLVHFALYTTDIARTTQVLLKEKQEHVLRSCFSIPPHLPLRSPGYSPLFVAHDTHAVVQ